jgi:hypothetical protein
MNAPPDLSVTSFTYTSSSVSGHEHQVTLEVALFASPPTSGVTRETTVADGHTHMVTLTMDELQTIAAGGTVSKDTTITQSHLHTFVFMNA